MKSIVLSVLAVALTAGVAVSQPKLVEKVTKKGSELVIPYEKYTLPNGLTIIVHEDHSDPVVYVDVTYHVGSARENEGRSGFAHFFEHMMFQGSEHVADEQHFKTVTEAGGTLNGTTNTDRTNYFEVMPSNQLETALWLESDRMGFLLDSVTQKKFEVQRATVKNERGQNYDNRPYGIAPEKIAAALYPPSHPYSWLTIGYIEDLNRVDVNDLKKFFLRWYGPNNATLTVAGDVKTADVLKLAEKYFGPIPRGAEVSPQSVQPVVLTENRYISYEDNVRNPQVTITFPTVPARHADEPALDVLADILGGGKSSIFYKNLVKTQEAQQAQVYHPTKELAGEFVLTVRATADKDMSKIESIMRNALKEFEARGVTEEDLKKFKAGMEANLINSLSSVQGKGATLAANQTFTGDPNYITRELARYNKLTAAEVMNAYNKYIKGKNSVILSVYPKGKPNLVARADNFTPPVRNVNVTEGEEYKKLVYNKAKDTFDRSKKPAAGPNPVVMAPDYWTEKTANGISFIGAKTTEIPSVTIQLNIEAGHRFEPKGKAGISGLTAAMLNEATKRHTSEQISELLESLGSSVSFYSGTQDITMYVTSLTKNLDATLEIAKEMLFEPAFSKEDFERVKNQRMDAIANQSTQATTIANNVYNKLLYGEDHIMSISALGTKESVNGITLADVTAFYKDNFAPSITRVVVVGEIDKADALKKLAFLNTWSQSSPVRAAEPASPKIDKTRIYMVNKEKAAQSEIRIGYMALPYDATGDYYKATVMNYVLGGAFNSRINLNLREAHGFTYGARSSFSGTRFAGPFTAAAGVRTNATDSSVIEFMKELKLYSDKGITAEELKFTQSSIGQGEALKYESPMQKAGFLSRIQDYNLGKDFVIKQNEILNSATPDMINQLAKKHLPLDKLIILVVGDKSMIYDGLVKTGYEVIELDADGNPVAAIAEKATEEKVEQKSPEQNSGKERAKGVRVTERKK